MLACSKESTQLPQLDCSTQYCGLKSTAIDNSCLLQAARLGIHLTL
jgi:hypothetical protein